MNYKLILPRFATRSGINDPLPCRIKDPENPQGVGVVGNPLVAGRMKEYGGVLFFDKTGAPLLTFLNVQTFYLKINVVYISLLL